jgi:excisionase family DNA binding protein
MVYTLKQAAAVIGKSKPTVLRAIQAGKISAVRDETTGGWLIDPAELHRLYPPVTAKMVHDAEMMNGVIHNETPLLRREVEILREERERERREAQTTIVDLRHRLDTATQQLGEALQQVRLLTDQRSPASGPIPPRRSWLPWRRRG